jgi:hypothetical protein
MAGIVPKFKRGDLVDVTEYYSDMIPKSYFHALVLEYNIFSFGGESPENHVIIYDVLGVEGDQQNSIQKVEEFAIRLVAESKRGKD